MTLLQRALLNLKLSARPTTLRAYSLHKPPHVKAVGRRHNSSQPEHSPSSKPPPKPERPTSGAPKDAATALAPTPKPEDSEPIDVPVSLWYRRLGPVTQFFGWFHRTQSKRPLTVQLCATLITYLCGDLLAQEIGGEEYSGWRTLRMLTIGGVASVPGYKW